MEDKVLSIKQMEHLKSVGFDTKNANLYWVRRVSGYDIDDDSTSEWFLVKDFIGVDIPNHKVIPTFTLHDIIDLLPKEIELDYGMLELCLFMYDNKWYFEYGNREASDNNILQAAYKMLCWCIENKYL